MKQNNRKRKIILITLFIVAIIIGIVVFIFLDSKDKNALDLNENKWVESNKQNVIDMAVINDIPVVSNDGAGIFYDYIDYVSKELSLNFNTVSFKLDDEINYDYSMKIVDKPTKDDMVLLTDYMVLISKSDVTYSTLSQLPQLRIGVLKADRELMEKYFDLTKIELVDYETYADLKNAMEMSEKNIKPVDSIIILKNLLTKEIISSDYKVSYYFNDIVRYVVIRAQGNSTLNSILIKKYNKWMDTEYNKSFNEELLELYFNLKQISDADQKQLKSKNYSYGFINYGIYNYLDKSEISGMSGLVLKNFHDFSGLSITYTQYNSMNKLLENFNSRKIDFILNLSDKYENEVYNTVGVFDKRLVVVSGLKNKDTINSTYSLKGKKVSTIKNTSIEAFLNKYGAKIKSYNNMGDMAKDFGSNDITILDIENYNYYKSTSFRDCKINYLFDIDDKYNYVINDTESNKIFEDLFDFYLNYFHIDALVYNNYEDIAYENTNTIFILIVIILILTIYVVLDFYTHFKVVLKTIRTSKKDNLTKEEKIKYIDQLTSLKNRAYLNSKIESWDESEVYPQAIIIIDLNNIAYINDNYGREEGDKVITEAANILIINQLQNSEIIRTDGNEFLIYMVGYNEKQIISYLRRLGKELKNLSHGFGAASGYSIINDAIKTIDDAVNEATLDMKNNKEDIDY